MSKEESSERMLLVKPNTSEDYKSHRAKKKASHSVAGHRDGLLFPTMGETGWSLFLLRVFQHGKTSMHITLRFVLCGNPAFGLIFTENPS